MPRRRSGKQTPVVKMKQRNPKKVSFGHAAIQKKWNKEKTLTENYANLGLAITLNDTIKSKQFSRKISEWNACQAANEHLDIYRSEGEIYSEVNKIHEECDSQERCSFSSVVEELQASTGRKAQMPRKAMPAAFAALKAKYGTDFKKMSMDISLNKQQLTEFALKRCFQNYN